MDEFVQYCIAWAIEDVKRTSDERLAAHKLPMLANMTTAALGLVGAHPTDVVDAFLMPLCRVVAADHRELWELLDHPARIPSRAGQRRSLWNEQQALKKAHVLLTAQRTQGGYNAEYNDAMMAYFCESTLLGVKPRRNNQPKTDAELSVDNHSGVVPATGAHGNSNVVVVPMQYDDEHAASWDSDGAMVDDNGSPAVEEVDVVGEGSLHCARPLPAFSPLLTIPRSDMFMVKSLTGRCALFDAIEAAGDAARSAFPDDETKLILCLVFERFFVAPVAVSHWSSLLSGCPRCYPTVPTFWGMHELAELEGNNMIDEVLAKKRALEAFYEASVAAIEVLGLVEHVVRILEARSADTASTWPSCGGARFRKTWQSAVFTLANLHWARATFDSRAFNLNVDGSVVLALVPVADMINHDVYSDVLMRHVGPNNGPFVMTTGAALTAADVGRELWMSYGPLQSWELVMSYGFVLDDNENDRVPFPIALEQDDDEADAYTKRRWGLIRANGLDIGNDWWIGASGVPCPALLALLRLQLAEVEHFPLLESGSVFDPLDAQLEARVVATVSMAHAAILDQFSTTLAEDEEMLLTEDRNNDDDAASNDSGDAPLSGNARIAIRLRVGMKKILNRVELWCIAQGHQAQHC